MYTLEDVVAAADRAVAAKPEGYKYPMDKYDGCAYATPDGEPSCLVGVILSEIAPDLFKLAVGREEWGVDPDNTENQFIGHSSTFMWLQVKVKEFHNRFTIEAEDFLHKIQQSQDRGLPWGEAVLNTAEDLGVVSKA